MHTIAIEGTNKFRKPHEIVHINKYTDEIMKQDKKNQHQADSARKMLYIANDSRAK